MSDNAEVDKLKKALQDIEAIAPDSQSACPYYGQWRPLIDAALKDDAPAMPAGGWPGVNPSVPR